MSGDDVDGNEMDDLNDFDDVTTEALMEGFGGDAEPAVGAFLDAVRSTYRSQPLVMDLALASFLTDELRPPSPAKKRFSNMRSLLTAKVALTVAAVVAGTGGLAVAGAITGVRPSVLQSHSHSHSKTHVGVNLPVHASQHAVDATSSNPSSAHDGEPPETTVAPPTTEPTDPPTTVSPDPTDPPQPCEADDSGSESTDDSSTDSSTNSSAVCPPGDGHEGSGDQGHDGSGDQGNQAGTSGDHGGNRVHSQIQPYADPGGDGDHVFYGAGNLRADDVIIGVEPKRGTGKAFLNVGRQRRVG